MLDTLELNPKPRNYIYSKLSEIDTNGPSSDRVNLYAFSIDASYPYKSVSFQDKYLCVIRIGDDSMNPLVKEEKLRRTVKVIIFAKSIEDLPIISEVGTIIRIHRGQAQIYKGRLQINCDVTSKGCWCIFPLKTQASSQLYLPKKHCKKSYTLIQSDFQRIDKIRESCDQFITNLPIFEFSLSLVDAEYRRWDFDALGIILSRQETKNHDYLKIHFCDATKVVSFQITKQRFNELKIIIGTCVRLRSFKIKKKDPKRKIKTRPHSNIISIPQEAKTSIETIKKIENTSNKEVKLFYKIYIDYLKEYKLTEMCQEIKSNQFTPLKKIINYSGKSDGKTFNIKVSCSKIYPEKVNDWIVKISQNKFEYKFEMSCLDILDSDDTVYIIEVDPEISQGFIRFDQEKIKDEKYIKRSLKCIKKLFIETNCILELTITKDKQKLIITQSKLSIEI